MRRRCTARRWMRWGRGSPIVDPEPTRQERSLPSWFCVVVTGHQWQTSHHRAQVRPTHQHPDVAAPVPPYLCPPISEAERRPLLAPIPAGSRGHDGHPGVRENRGHGREGYVSLAAGRVGIRATTDSRHPPHFNRQPGSFHVDNLAGFFFGG